VSADHTAHIPVHAHQLGQPLAHEQVGHRLQGGLGMKVGARLRID